MSHFDASDRSARFLMSAFDPSATVNPEEDDFYAVAIADYRSDEPTDLKFERGDKIKIVLQHNSGWWDGELNGARGSFPKTFVQVEGRIDIKNEPIGAVFLVILDHEGSRGGDIALLAGDLVYVDFLVKERCTGINLRTKLKGNFPLSKLERQI